MSKKIFFIGDSWVTNLLKFNNYVEGTKCPIKSFWSNKGYSSYFLGDPSRDTQTVLDIWIKCIPHLTSDDLLVVFLPVFNRLRLPMNEKQNVCTLDNSTKINNYFQGVNSYNPKFNFLEIWGNQYDSYYFNDKLEIQELINGSNASILNYIEVIESLYKITSCKKIVHCWDYKKHHSDVIIYREEMTELVGMWDTRDDSHWSDDMNIEFMNFLFKYFNIETSKITVSKKNLI